MTFGVVDKDVRVPVATIYGKNVEKYAALWREQVEVLKKEFGEKIQQVLFPGQDTTDVPILFVSAQSIVSVLSFCKKTERFFYEFLSDITATDEMPEKPRFHVVYQLFSQQTGARIRIKVRLEEGQEIPTVISVWKGANWAEREVWDMFGIRFTGHPDLRRILMDQRWEGHPLRKDYPLRGYQVFPTPEPIEPHLLEEGARDNDSH